MQRFESQIDPSRQFASMAARLGTVLLLCWLAGCGKGVAPTTQTATTTPEPQTYFAPFVNGSSGLGQAPLTYTFDDVAGAFSQTSYQSLTQPGPDVLSAGGFMIGQRGLRSLDISAAYSGTSASKPGSFAVELADQAGGLVQMVGQSAQPLVAATQCPNSSTQTYQFVTIPAPLSYQLQTGNPGQPPTYQAPNQWNPKTDTAYGSVDIVSSGSTVTFQDIHQYTLPSEGGTGAPAQPPSSSVTGACGPTFFGNTTNVPGQLVVTDPGNGQSNPPQAHVGIGPTGLLVEDNGHSPNSGNGFLANTAPALQYNNVLGAGTGAVGLPKPSSALDTGALAGAQYLGFIYEAGANSSSVTSSSNLASFGFSSMPPGCPSVAASSTTPLIYGGDFPVNQTTGLPDPGPSNSQNPNYPYGKCDFVIDLGAPQDSSNSLYTQAKVWVGGSYPGNSTAITYPFSAVAVAGQLGGKYAIFLIGIDSIQPWAIHLLQSN